MSSKWTCYFCKRTITRSPYDTYGHGSGHAAGCDVFGPATPRVPAVPDAQPEMCCGGTCVRAVCEYHRPQARYYPTGLEVILGLVPPQ